MSAFINNDAHALYECGCEKCDYVKRSWIQKAAIKNSVNAGHDLGRCQCERCIEARKVFFKTMMLPTVIQTGNVTIDRQHDDLECNCNKCLEIAAEGLRKMGHITVTAATSTDAPKGSVAVAVAPKIEPKQQTTTINDLVSRFFALIGELSDAHISVISTVICKRMGCPPDTIISSLMGGGVNANDIFLMKSMLDKFEEKQVTLKNCQQ